VGRWERAVKWAKRRPAAAALVAVSSLSALALGIVIGLYHAQLQEALQDARGQEGLTRQQEFMTRRYWYVSDINLAEQVLEKRQAARLVEILDGQRPRPGQPDLRGFEWHYLWRQCHGERLTLGGHKGPVGRVVFSPDGKALVSATPFDDDTKRGEVKF